MNMTGSIAICALVVRLICALTNCGDKGNGDRNEIEF
jgi:hypothetical protein